MMRNALLHVWRRRSASRRGSFFKAGHPPMQGGDSSGLNRLDLRTVEDEGGFLALRPHWDALFYGGAVNCVDQSFLWARTAWETTARAKRRSLHIIVGEADSRVVLILPFLVQRWGPLRIGRWLGPEYQEYCDILVASHSAAEQWVAQAWDVGISRFHALRLPAVRSDAKIWPHVQQARALHSMPTRSPYVDCRQWPNWETYYASRSRNFRRDCKKSLGRLANAGTPRFIVVGEHQIGATVDWLLARKVEWLDRHGFEETSLSTKKSFFSRYCREALPKGEVLLIELLLNETRIAAQLAFHAGDRLDATMAAWAQDWQACAPGRLIDVETIRWAFEHGLGSVDLGMGTPDYKYRFAEKDLAVAKDVTIAPPPLGHVLLGSLLGLRQFQRAAFQVRRYSRGLKANLAGRLAKVDGSRVPTPS
jgi:CelD/BcsL family acetyltransferase involved in cellulose biosynthesis